MFSYATHHTVSNEIQLLQYIYLVPHYTTNFYCETGLNYEKNLIPVCDTKHFILHVFLLEFVDFVSIPTTKIGIYWNSWCRSKTWSHFHPHKEQTRFDSNASSEHGNCIVIYSTYVVHMYRPVRISSLLEEVNVICANLVLVVLNVNIWMAGITNRSKTYSFALNINWRIDEKYNN